MGLETKPAFQAALIARLRAGVALGAAADGGDIPVRDRPMENAPLLYIRVDGFNYVDAQVKNAKEGLLFFNVHVFAQPGNDAGAASVGAEVSRIQVSVLAALEDWRALESSGLVIHKNSKDGAGDDPAHHHAISRFSIYLGE